MKMRKKTPLILLTVICLLAMPLGALAAPAAPAAPGQSRVTLGNFYYSAGKYAGDIDLALSVATGQTEDGRAYAEAEATGGERPIGRAAAAFQDGGAVLWLDGLTNSYTITWDEIKQYIKTHGEVPEDLNVEALFGIIEGYGRYLLDVQDPAVQARVMEELEAVMAQVMRDARVSEEPEEVMVLDEPAQLKSVRFSMDSRRLDAFVRAYAKASPGFEMFLANYAKLFSEALGASFDGDRLFSSLEQQGLRYEIDVTMWADESGRCSRVEADFRMIAKSSSAQPYAMPVAIEFRDDGSGRRTRMTMEQTVGDTTAAYRIYERESDGGHSIELEMDVKEDDKTQLSVAFKSVYALEENGRETLSLAGTAGRGGEVLRGEASYAGERTGDGRSGRVTMELKVPTSEGMETAELSFDIDQITGPADEGVPAQLDALEPISIVQMDEAQAASLLRELTAAGIGALGGVLQTPGVAELISETTTALFTAYSFQTGTGGASAGVNP